MYQSYAANITAPDSQYLAEPSEPSITSAKVLAIWYAFVALIGLPANMFILISTISAEHLRTVPLNSLIFSLGLADSLFLISSSVPQLLWAINQNATVCKIGGFGWYLSAMITYMIPPCLAMDRYVTISDDHDPLGVRLQSLISRFGINLLTVVIWISMIVFFIPFIYFDKFGLDPMGICGVRHLNSLLFTIYYLAGTSSIVTTCYILTIFFYRRLAKSVSDCCSLMTMSANAQRILKETSNLLLMTKWLMIAPLLFIMPSIAVETALRFYPKFVSVTIGRSILSTFSLCSMINPLVTIFFTKRYRRVLQSVASKSRVTKFCYLLFVCGKESAVSPANEPTGT